MPGARPSGAASATSIRWCAHRFYAARRSAASAGTAERISLDTGTEAQTAFGRWRRISLPTEFLPGTRTWNQESRQATWGHASSQPGLVPRHRVLPHACSHRSRRSTGGHLATAKSSPSRRPVGAPDRPALRGSADERRAASAAPKRRLEIRSSERLRRMAQCLPQLLRLYDGQRHSFAQPTGSNWRREALQGPQGSSCAARSARLSRARGTSTDPGSADRLSSCQCEPAARTHRPEHAAGQPR